MASITYQVPVNGDLNSVADPEVSTALTTLLSFANGGIDKGNLAANPGILKLTSLSNHTIAFGSVALTGPDGSFPNYSNIVTVTHGLGSTPLAIVTTMSNNDTHSSVVGTPNSTSFQVRGKELPNGFTTLSGFVVAYHQFGNGQWGSSTGVTSPTCYWIAIA